MWLPSTLGSRKYHSPRYSRTFVSDPCILVKQSSVFNIHISARHIAHYLIISVPAVSDGPEMTLWSFFTSRWRPSPKTSKSRDQPNPTSYALISMSNDESAVKTGELSPLLSATDFESEESSSSILLVEKKPPWWSYIWVRLTSSPYQIQHHYLPQTQDYDPGRSQQEIKFIQKLDLGLLTILSLGYFIKNLDQTNISNAYVSGMKEALHMTSNELNLIDVAWTTGYVIGQLPSQFILTKVRPSIWIPSCELIWTILTFCLAAATSSNQVIAIRFFVGLVESIFYPAAHFLIGSWYLPSELGKRACVFHASAAAAGMFSGYLQAAVYTGLNGVMGKAGWQWLFIMDGIISLPICLAGYFLIPDSPENTRAFYLNGDDRLLARKRMNDAGRAPRREVGWGILKRVFSRWHVYGLTVLYIIFITTGPSSSVSPLALWLKDTGWPVTKIVSPLSNQGCLTEELTD